MPGTTGDNLRNENEEKGGSENIGEASAARNRFIQGVAKRLVRFRALVYPFPQTREKTWPAPVLFLSSHPA